VDETNAIRARAAGASQGAQQRTTMKEKPNYAELEKRIDFTALGGRLGQLTEADNPQRKTVFTLLDKVREQIVEARRNRKVSYQVLAKELTSAGIPVSEPTLRKYLRAQGVEKKQRKKAAPSNGNGNGKPAASSATAEAKPAAAAKPYRFSPNA
jgi:ribosome-binding protein aMBF1 (putative translation factor)